LVSEDTIFWTIIRKWKNESLENQELERGWTRIIRKGWDGPYKKAVIFLTYSLRSMQRTCGCNSDVCEWLS
jgi:hypothetical protein